MRMCGGQSSLQIDKIAKIMDGLGPEVGANVFDLKRKTFFWVNLGKQVSV